MSSDVKKNVQICQGIDSYDDMVHDATQRFPELKDVEEPLGFIVDKYDLDSYPEFPLSYLWDCDEDEDCDDEEDDDEDEDDVGENYEEEDVGENYDEDDYDEDDEDVGEDYDGDDDYDDYDDYDDDEEDDNNDYDDDDDDDYDNNDEDNEDEENEDDDYNNYDDDEDGDDNFDNYDEDEDGENEDDDDISTTSSDMDEEAEEQAADAIEQLLPEFIDSFHILNSSSSLNYIFSPMITLPVPYKKDDAYSDCSLRPLRNSGSSARPEDYDI